MTARKDYFDYLEFCHSTGFARQKMMATVFLGPQERFSEGWKAQREELEKHHNKEVKKESPKAVTMDQIKDLYAKKDIRE